MSGTRFGFEVWFYSAPHGSDEQFRDFLTAVVGELVKPDSEINVAVSTEQRRVEFTVIDLSDTFEMAVCGFLDDLQRACTTAGRILPFAPDYRPANRVIRELDDEQAQEGQE